MKKYYIIPLIVTGILIALYAICTITKVFAFYKTSATSNFPSIKNGERFIISNLVKPKRFNFICFYTTTAELGKIMRVCRLCGIPGDVVQIKNGILYVNEKNADEEISTASRYRVKNDDFEKLRAFVPENDDQFSGVDSMDIDVVDKAVTANKLPAMHVVFTVDYLQEGMSKQLKNNNNVDNAGPFVVPAGDFFVMGDNRHSAEDSRYLGFIPQKDFAATVIGKK